MFDMLQRWLAGPSVPEHRITPSLESEVRQLLLKTDSESLSQDAKKWLVSIPENVWPKLICLKNPSVVNDLADLWSQSVRFDSYVDDLIAQHHPAGLPTSYREELKRLKAYRQEGRNAHVQRADHKRSNQRSALASEV